MLDPTLRTGRPRRARAALTLALLGAPSLASAAPATIAEPESSEANAAEPASEPATPAAPGIDAPPAASEPATLISSSEASARPETSGDEPLGGAHAPMSRMAYGPHVIPPRGVGMLTSGAVLAGLGVAGRVALEVYWGAVVGLEPSDPFQKTSTRNIILLTNVNNVFVVSGLGLLAGGLYRRGLHDGMQRPRPLADKATTKARFEKMRRDGVIILTLGAALWGSTRGIFLGIANDCSTNGCVYGYLESTYWATAIMVHVGAGMLAYSSGRLRADRGREQARFRWTLTPMLGRARGLGVAGSF